MFSSSSPRFSRFRRPSSSASSARVRWVAVALLSMTAAACGKQGEGERCDLLNYSQDCDDGLTCTEIERSGAAGAVCCPANPTVDICQSGGLDYQEDGGSSESPTSDGGPNQSSSDGNQSSSLDAGSSTSAIDGSVGQSNDIDASTPSTTSESPDTDPLGDAATSASLTPDSSSALLDAAP